MITRFTIDRARWANGSVRGKETGPSRLRNKQGNQCCLGFFCAASGVQELLNVVRPKDLRWADRKRVPDLIEDGWDSPLTGEAIAINDSPFLNAIEREQRLIVLFAGYGIEVVFVGDYPRERIRKKKDYHLPS